MKNINLVKIWSDSISEANLERLLNDIIEYEKNINEKFIIISSGSVTLGKNKVKEKWLNIEKMLNSSLASIWQQYLMQMYDKLSKDKLVWQVLLDDYINTNYINSFIEQVKDRKILKKFASIILWLVSDQKDKHLAHTIWNMVKNDILVIINHNDTTSNDELKNLSSKTDNDKNTIHITEVINKYSQEINMKIHRVIYLTNTNWLLDENKNTIIWWLVDLIEESKYWYLEYIETEKSNNWTWWMWSKVNCAFEVLEKWAFESIIANSNTWLDCLNDEHLFSTKFKRK